MDAEFEGKLSVIAKYNKVSTFLNRNTVYSTLSGDYTYISIIFFRIQGEYTVDVVFIYRVELACYKMGMYRARDFLCKGIDICRFKRSLDNIDTRIVMAFRFSLPTVLQNFIREELDYSPRQF